MSRSTSSPRDTATGLERLGAVAQNPSLSGALGAARELLGMGLSYVTRLTDEEQVLLHADGDAESFGVGVGTRLPLEETYCHHILDGRLPALMRTSPRCRAPRRWR